jgi:hypothetical protein
MLCDIIQFNMNPFTMIVALIKHRFELHKQIMISFIQVIIISQKKQTHNYYTRDKHFNQLFNVDNTVTCMECLQTGFQLVIGFTEHLQIATISNYNYH